MADVKISQLPNGQGISSSSAAATITLNRCVIGGTDPKAATFTDVTASAVFTNTISAGSGVIDVVSASAVFTTSLRATTTSAASLFADTVVASAGRFTTVSAGSAILPSSGGTGQTSYTDGQLLIGNTAGGLTKATLTAGSNITITNGNGSIEIAASGSVGTSFAAITGATNTSAAMVIGSGASLSPTGTGSIVATSLASTLPVNQGGTAITSAAAYSVLCAGTTSTGGFQTVSGTGSSGQVLTSNGAGALPSWQASSGGGSDMTVLASAAASNSLSLSFDSTYITNSYSRYRLTWRDIICATSALSFSIQVSQDNGSNWLASTSYAYQLNNIISGANNAAGSSGTTRIVIGPSVGNASGNNTSGSVEFYSPTVTGDYKIFNFRGAAFDNSGNFASTNGSGALVVNTNGFNAIRLVFGNAAGNILSGTAILSGGA